METTPDARVTRSGDRTSASPFDPQLVEAVVGEAARDAEAVALFLRELGFVPTPDHPIRFPAPFLLHLGAALRLLAWEDSGLRVHHDADLPPAERTIRDAFARLGTRADAEAQPPPDLARRVVALFAERFAWHGRRDLGAAVVLDQLHDDALVEALAKLLWQARHARGGPSQSRTEVSDG